MGFFLLAASKAALASHASGFAQDFLPRTVDARNRDGMEMAPSRRRATSRMLMAGKRGALAGIA